MKTVTWTTTVALIGILIISDVTALAKHEKNAGRRPPSFIVMMADDLGAAELSCYGNTKHQTPRLDELGCKGIRFDTCYSTPICHPTRFEIMTGQYGHHNRVYHFPGRPGGPSPADDEIAKHLTFVQVLKSAGYATALAGKWQLTGKHPTLIHECGFDEYCMWAYKHNLPEGVEHTGAWEGKPGTKTCRYWHPSIVRNGKYVPTTISDYGPDIFADFVIDFARRHKDEPFFIYYPMCLTHAWHLPTPDSVKSEESKLKHSQANFPADVEYTDKIVGRIVDAMKELGIADNTVILFTGDNGTGGRGKGQTTELGARVPMIVYGPGVVKGTGLCKELIDLSDVFPTLMEMAGADVPDGHVVDGRSFAHLLRGEQGPVRDWIYAYLGGRRVVRTKRWLLENNSPTQFGQFYDCSTCRDGTDYKKVTESNDPEVVAARRMIEKILTDKPVPDVSWEDQSVKKPRKKRAPEEKRKRQPAGKN